MRFGHALEPKVGISWHLARQMGIETAVAIKAPVDDIPIWDFLTLARVKQLYEDFGFKLEVIEGWLPMDNIRRGAPGAEEERDLVVKTIRNMGALGISVFCYNWSAHFISWVRTSFSTRTRGNALTTSYDHAVMQKAVAGSSPTISEDQLWSTLERFLTTVVPVAEKAGVKLAMHPDDPPISPIAGVSRIFTTPEAFERLLGLVESEANGITFCQGNFAAMDVDIPATIHRLGKTGRIYFVHFRDIRGNALNFTEVFHDDGKTDMFAAMKAYRDIGFSGPMRLDHSPTVEGDTHENPGYEPRGRLFAMGYMKGLLEGVDALRAHERQVHAKLTDKPLVATPTHATNNL